MNMKTAPERVRRAAKVKGSAYLMPTFITTQLYPQNEGEQGEGDKREPGGAASAAARGIRLRVPPGNCNAIRSRATALPAAHAGARNPSTPPC